MPVDPAHLLLQLLLEFAVALVGLGDPLFKRLLGEPPGDPLRRFAERVELALILEPPRDGDAEVTLIELEADVARRPVREPGDE